MENDKTYMFQYCRDEGVHCAYVSMSDTKVIEDTGLITRREAIELWDKYYNEVIQDISKGRSAQMCIWRNCTSDTDYGDVLKEIDTRDELVVRNGKIYKVTTKEKLIS